MSSLLVRVIPIFAVFRQHAAAVVSVLVACTPAPGLRHGTVPMPLDEDDATESRPPEAVASLVGTRACLGTLVGRRLVLTAAHCVVDGARHSHVRLGRGTGRVPVVVSGCRVHPRAFGGPTACEVQPPGRLQTAFDLALLELMQDVPAEVARPLPVLLRAPPRLVGFEVFVVSAHATEWQASGPWRVSRHRVESFRDGRLVTRAFPGQPWLGTRPGDSGGPALLARGDRWLVAGALSGGRTSWSADSRFAATFTLETARWLAQALGDDGELAAILVASLARPHAGPRRHADDRTTRGAPASRHGRDLPARFAPRGPAGSVRTDPLSRGPLRFRG